MIYIIRIGLYEVINTSRQQHIKAKQKERIGVPGPSCRCCQPLLQAGRWLRCDMCRDIRTRLSLLSSKVVYSQPVQDRACTCTQQRTTYISVDASARSLVAWRRWSDIDWRRSPLCPSENCIFLRRAPDLRDWGGGRRWADDGGKDWLWITEDEASGDE